MNEVTEALRGWLASGGHAIGEIHIRSLAPGWELRHRRDEGFAELADYAGAEAARELAHHTSEGEFRPLKTAPNLRRGWRLIVSDLDELRLALDYFYPAMLAIGLSHTRGRLAAVPLRTTLARQTGMYRVTQRISDEQAQELIGGFCRSDVGCLKHILWPLEPDCPVTTLPPEKFSPGAGPGEWPLLCHEACNLLVAKAREVVKRAEVPV